MAMTTNGIIEKLKKGDESAFRQLVENYQDMVVNTSFGLVHNSDDAQDIAQEVFIEVFRSIHNFRADAKISTWLYRIAVNRSLNFIRDNKRHKWYQSFDDAVKSRNSEVLGLSSGHNSNPDFELENSQRAVLLHEAIDNLPENQRTAFTLSKYEDLSYQEIAEVMELSVSSVESLLHRAKKNLQKKLHTCYKERCI